MADSTKEVFPTFVVDDLLSDTLNKEILAALCRGGFYMRMPELMAEFKKRFDFKYFEEQFDATKNKSITNLATESTCRIFHGKEIMDHCKKITFYAVDAETNQIYRENVLFFQILRFVVNIVTRKLIKLLNLNITTDEFSGSGGILTRLLSYELVEKKSEEDLSSTEICDHVDFDLFTVLMFNTIDSDSGMFYLDQDNIWKMLENRFDCLFIQTGEILRMLTDDKMKSLAHKVQLKTKKLSLLTFVSANKDFKFKPIKDDRKLYSWINDRCDELGEAPVTFDKFAEEAMKIMNDHTRANLK